MPPSSTLRALAISILVHHYICYISYESWCRKNTAIDNIGDHPLPLAMGQASSPRLLIPGAVVLPAPTFSFPPFLAALLSPAFVSDRLIISSRFCCYSSRRFTNCDPGSNDAQRHHGVRRAQEADQQSESGKYTLRGGRFFPPCL